MMTGAHGPFFGPIYGYHAAARELEISVTWLRELVQAGKGTPTVPVGGCPTRRVFSREDLENLARATGRKLREEAAAPRAA